MGAALALLLALPAAALTIDNFGVPLSGGTVFANGFDRAFGAMLGGDRELTLTGFGSARILLGVYHENVHSTPGSTLSASLVWDGSGVGDTNGLDFGLGLDLSGEEDRIVWVGGDNRPTSSFQLTLYTSSTVWTRMALGLGSCGGLCGHASELEAALAAGTQGPGGGVDLTNVNAVQITTTGTAGTGAGLDLLVFTVPEPAPLVLLLAAPLLAALRRR